ncbi:MAG TPA: hypothetical protein VGR56_01240 [Nitrososphaerales archaeon]|nr:hypothetical protein [Nitrososphaerales archaeon]
MNDYEKAFVERMSRLERGGVNFELFAKEAVEAKFGGAAEVVFRGLKGDAFMNPEVFVRELSRVFGRGAMGIYEPIMKQAERGMIASSSGNSSPYDSLLRQLGVPQGPAPVQGVMLHDHRVKDEEGNYSDNAN